jgi:hypothetical protein
MMLVIAIMVCSSCELDKNEPNAKADSKFKPINLLNTKKWDRVAHYEEPILMSVLAGSFQTASFATQQENELRWYNYFYQNLARKTPIDLVLTTDDKLTVTKPPFLYEQTIRELKTVYNNNVWEVGFIGNAHYIYKNDALLTEKLAYEKYAVKADDGFFTYEQSGTARFIQFYSYETGEEKFHSIGSYQNYIPLRYQDTTYVVAYNEAGWWFFEETDEEKISGSTTYYPMAVKNRQVEEVTGLLLQYAQHDHIVHVMLKYQSSKLRVYELNLKDQTAKTLFTVPLANYGYMMPAKLRFTIPDIYSDPNGNVYVREIRYENHNSHPSIRKYNASGESEVVLAEDEIIDGTEIQAITYFNGKIHVALKYREELPDNNPEDDASENVIHFQIIRLK